MTKPRKAAKKPKTKALAPQTTPPDPEDRRQPVYILPQRTSGVRVNEETALTLNAVWACIRVITESLSGLRWEVYRGLADDGTWVKIPRHPLNYLLNVEPNSEVSALMWRRTIASHALTWGNGYAEIERNFVGEPVNLWLITPDRVEVVRFRGRIVYDVANPSAPNTVLEANEMYHLKGLGFDGLVGYSVIKMFARSIGLGIALEENGSSFMANGSRPDGLLKHPGKLSETARKNLDESWKRRHGGPNNRGTFAILEEGMDYEAVSLPPDDAQFVQQRQLTPTEICRIFRVPPHKIADLTRSTNNNIEHQGREFVDDTIKPWGDAMRSEANVKLFGRNNRGTLETFFDYDDLKEADTAARTARQEKLFDRGALSVNDIRREEGLPSIGPDGDKRFVPLNMVTLENAGKPEPESDDEPESEAPTMDEPDDRLSRVEASCLPVLQDAFRRILRREVADKHLHADVDWLAKHRTYCRETLTPAARILAELHTKTPCESVAVAVSVFIERHLSSLGSDSEPEAKANELRGIIIAAAAAHKEAA